MRTFVRVDSSRAAVVQISGIQSRSRRFALSVMHVMYGEDDVILKVYSHYNVKCFYTYLKSTKADVNRGNYSVPTKTTVTPATGR